MAKKKICECGEKAAFFHSKCCGAHFEGVVKSDGLYIACEECEKICGKVKINGNV